MIKYALMPVRRDIPRPLPLTHRFERLCQRAGNPVVGHRSALSFPCPPTTKTTAVAQTWKNEGQGLALDMAVSAA